MAVTQSSFFTTALNNVAVAHMRRLVSITFSEYRARNQFEPQRLKA